MVSHYLRHSNIELGRWRLEGLAVPILRRIGPTLGKRTINTKHGFSMRLDLRDRIAQDIYLRGNYEPTTSAIANMLLKPGDIAVDVGANIGFFSLLFSQRVGTTGKVLSFEPSRSILSKLRDNIRLNQSTSINVFEDCLSDICGKAMFALGPNSNSGLSTLRTLTNGSGTTEVDTIKFDDIPLDGIDIKLIKIDVEGAECKVLRGMAGHLKRSHPALIVEVTDSFLRDMGESTEGLIAYLRELGYFCYVIGEGRMDLLDNYNRSLPSQFNALFVPARNYGVGCEVRTEIR